MGEDYLYEHIRKCIQVHKNIHTRAIIDTAAILRFFDTRTYAERLYENLNGSSKIDYVLYFANNGNSHKNNTNAYNPTEYSKDKFIIIFDNVNTRGTDVKLPKGTHGYVTVSHINDSVNVMQGIYRLRQLGNGQTCEFLVNTNVITEQNFDLRKYLEKNTISYMTEQEEELLIQTVYANDKWKKNGRSYTYVEKTMNIPAIPTTIQNNDIKTILHKNFALDNKLQNVCEDNCSLYQQKYISMLKKYVANRPTFNIETSISTSTSTSKSNALSLALSNLQYTETPVQYKTKKPIVLSDIWYFVRYINDEHNMEKYDQLSKYTYDNMTI